MATFKVKEYLCEFSKRSELGRVVITPPTKMIPPRIHSRGLIIMCCGRAFLSDECFQKHRQEERHQKPLDISFMREICRRRSVPDNNSFEFSLSRKQDPPLKRLKKYSCNDGKGEKGNLEYNDDVISKKPVKAAITRDGSSKRVSVCHLCGLNVSAGSEKKHMRTCHNPMATSQCRFCSCRFFTPNGCKLHESLSHLLKKSYDSRLTNLSMSQDPIEETPKSSSKSFDDYQHHCPGKINELKPASHTSDATILEHHKVGQNDFKEDMARHSNSKNYKCTYCTSTFKLPSHIQRHIKACHVGTAIYKCSTCGGPFTSYQGFLCHQRLAHGKKIIPKKVTPFEIPRSDQALTGRKKNSSEFEKTEVHSDLDVDSKTCHHCGHQFDQLSVLMSHLKSHRNKQHECALCPAHFPHPVNVQKHMKVWVSHSEDSNIPCPFCSCKFKSWVSLRNHKNAFHRERVVKKKKSGMKKIIANLQCNLCQMKFKCLETLSRHQEISHNSVGKHQCSICSCRYLRKDYLIRHLKSFHGKEEVEADQPIIINIAGNVQNDKVAPINSESENFIAYPYDCSQCGNNFQCLADLTEHQNTSHVQNGRYPCDKCSCTFVSPHLLAKHYSAHEVSDHIEESRARVSPDYNEREETTKNSGASLLSKGHGRQTELGSSESHSKTTEGKHIKKEFCEADGGVKETKDLVITRDQLPQTEDTVSQTQTQSNGNGLKRSVARKRTTSVRYNRRLKEIAKSTVLICNECGAPFHSQLELGCHLKRHQEDKPEVCDICGAKFRDVSKLNFHKKVSHVDGGEYKCEQCPCQFETMFAYKRHTTHAHGEIRKSEIEYELSLKQMRMTASPVGVSSGLDSVEIIKVEPAEDGTIPEDGKKDVQSVVK